MWPSATSTAPSRFSASSPRYRRTYVLPLASGERSDVSRPIRSGTARAQFNRPSPGQRPRSSARERTTVDLPTTTSAPKSEDLRPSARHCWWKNVQNVGNVQEFFWRSPWTNLPVTDTGFSHGQCTEIDWLAMRVDSSAMFASDQGRKFDTTFRVRRSIGTSHTLKNTFENA